MIAGKFLPHCHSNTRLGRVQTHAIMLFYDEILLSGHLPVPQGWPLNLGLTVFKTFHAVGAPNSSLFSESVKPSVCFGSGKLM